MAGEKEKTGAMVCGSEGEGINVVDDVINYINIQKQKNKLEIFRCQCSWLPDLVEKFRRVFSSTRRFFLAANTPARLQTRRVMLSFCRQSDIEACLFIRPP